MLEKILNKKFQKKYLINLFNNSLLIVLEIFFFFFLVKKNFNINLGELCNQKAQSIDENLQIRFLNIV